MRKKQCRKCPWLVSTDPLEIPGGYRVELHEALRSTIAEKDAIDLGGPLRMMACHESQVGAEAPCVGWIDHQLGRGGNLKLRLAAARRPDLLDYELIGEQREAFEDTLPSSARVDSVEVRPQPTIEIASTRQPTRKAWAVAETVDGGEAELVRPFTSGLLKD